MASTAASVCAAGARAASSVATGASSKAATHSKLYVEELGRRAYAFYKSIGSPKYIVAPMVNASELPFRMLCRKYGAQLCYTPMIHSRMYNEKPHYRKDNFHTVPADRPLIAQICGHDPDVVLSAALKLQDHCDAIDLNLGCPQGIARKGRYGAFLLSEPDVVISVIEKLAANLSIPVTAKLRILSTGGIPATVAFCKRLEAAGAAIVTLHGRTKEDKGHCIGACNWEAIRCVKQALRVPVFANGGIGSLADVKACLEYTGADGVMVSEAMLEWPSLFVDNIDPATGKLLSQFDLAREYMVMVGKYPVPRKPIMSHLFKILHSAFMEFPDFRPRFGAALKDDAALTALVTELETRVRAAAGSSASGGGGGGGGGAGGGAGAHGGGDAQTIGTDMVTLLTTTDAGAANAATRTIVTDAGCSVPLGGPWYMRHWPQYKERARAKRADPEAIKARKEARMVRRAAKKERAKKARQKRSAGKASGSGGGGGVVGEPQQKRGRQAAPVVER